MSIFKIKGTSLSIFQLFKNKHYFESNAGIILGKIISNVYTLLCKISDSGVFSIPNQSTINVERTTAQTIGNNTWTKVQFNSIVKDTQNEYDATNFRFISQNQGEYLVNSILTYVADRSRSRGIEIYKNGVPTGVRFIVQGNTDNTNLVTNISISYTLSLNVNDYIEIYTWQNTGANLNLTAGGNYFNVIKIA